MIIYAHRGIDLDRPEKLPENSLAAFRRCAMDGFGIELDLQISADQNLLIAHDATAERWSGGRKKVTWNKITDGELFLLENQYGPLARLPQVLDLAEEFPALPLAVHVKGANQTPALIKRLIEALARRVALHARILIFDLKPEVGALLRRTLPGVSLAASVAHDYDISRYQKMVNGTLMSVDSLLMTQGIYDCAWLDEWDREGRKNSRKSFYSPELIAQMTRRHLRAVLLSPELHRGERHADAFNEETLRRRWVEILGFGASAICTDYPGRVRALVES